MRWVNIRVVAERKLQTLNLATRLDNLRVPPNNRLELLKGDRSGQYSICINEQWRICFRFDEPAESALVFITINFKLLQQFPYLWKYGFR